MKLNEYQRESLEFNDIPEQIRIIYSAVGLAEEAGEVCGKIKRLIYDNVNSICTRGRLKDYINEEQKLYIAKELGDVMWHLAQLSEEIGWSLEDVAGLNLEKLLDRSRRGVIRGEGDER